MEYKKKKRKRSSLPFVILALVLVAGIAAGVVLSVSGAFGSLFAKKGPAPTPYVAAGDAAALRLAAVENDASEEGLRSYYAGAISYAQQNGLNTLIYEGKTDITVFWRDGYFPSNELVTAKDSLFNKSFDPLAILLEEAEGKDVQVWLEMDAFTPAGYTSGLKGKVAKLAAKEGTINAENTEYMALLQKSLAELPQSYGLAGVVLRGLEATVGTVPFQEFSDMARAVKEQWAAAGFATGLLLYVPEGGLAMGGGGVAKIQAGGGLDGALVELGRDKAYNGLGEWASLPSMVVVPTGDAAEVLFLTATEDNFAGAQLANYASRPTGEEITLLKTSMEPPVKEDGTVDTLPVALSYPTILSVNYPAEGANIYTETTFIMGNSDPDQELYLNGTPVQRFGTNGAFGVLVELEYGENSFTFANGDRERILRVNRPQGGGGGGGTTGGSDGTQEAEAGQGVRMTGYITSAMLEDSINETFAQGAVAVVQQSYAVTRNGLDSWAYRLSSGDYVYADQVEWVADGQSRFTGLSVESADKGEYIVLEGSGTPAAYIAYAEAENALKLTFYDTSFTLGDGFSSALVRSAGVAENEDGSVTLTLHLERIWGYNIEYDVAANTTRLFLKQPVSLSDDELQPLKGVHIMLDPGHGLDDLGALGVMGSADGPNEKHVNLALAQTIAYRLRQLGATVTMTREDDSFPTLVERLQMQNEVKPDFFLSVHHNSIDLDRDVNEVQGAQAFYYHPYSVAGSKELATYLQNSIAPATGRKDRGVTWYPFYVTRTTVCPSVLYEYGFMVNPAEFEDITSQEGMTKAALATANAFVEMLAEQR